MFVADLGCAWLAHPFARSSFLLRTDADVRRVRALRTAAVTIDCARGEDVLAPPEFEAPGVSTEARIQALAAQPALPAPVSLAEEVSNATAVRREAGEVVRSVMQDARLGKAVEVGRVAAVVEDVTTSILRNASALVSLTRIKSKDGYTFNHSVSVCALLVAFCRSRGMDVGTMYEAGIGGLLHDTGKALIPDAILNKPGRLTPEEFEIVRRHPRDGYDILRQTRGIGPVPLDIALHHHERPDGTGYPERQRGEQLSELSRMAALVDVYDAITSDRCYHKGMPAAEALRKMLEWSTSQFDQGLTHEFIRLVGIYPLGTLVLLESGRLGVVVEPHPVSLLTPKVRVFFSTRSGTYIQPLLVDLSRGVGLGGADRIISAESAQKWRVDPERFMAPA